MIYERYGVMAFKIVRNDITKMKVDAIVNTANEAPVYSDGVDTAVYEAAGIDELLAQRRKIGFMKEGDVAITPGFKLTAKYIIHAVSPFYKDGKSGEEELLRSCYKKNLKLAYKNQCKSIAFPLISTGCFGYPKEEGMRIALDEINSFLMKHDMLIYLVVFDNEATRLGLNLYSDLEEYIDNNYVCDKRKTEYGNRYFDSFSEEHLGYDANKIERKPARNAIKQSKEDINEFCEWSVPMMTNMRELSDDVYEDFLEKNESALKERISHMSDTFQQYLMYLIGSRGLTNSEVYKRAIITKQLFSKIKLNEKYHPDKATAMRLCVGAKLNLDETKDLLARAGYALSPCDKRDIIFSFFIEQEVFDMIEIDIALEEHGLPCFIE